MSNETALTIDKEIKRLVEDGLKRAREVITAHIDQLHRIAGALLELETLTGDEIKTLASGGEIDREADKAAPLPAAGSSIPKSRRPKGGIGGPAAAGA